MVLVLNYKDRTVGQKPNSFRKEGRIPAIFYGRKTASKMISLALRDFEKVWKQAGENTVVNLNNGSEEVQALIHDVDRHPVTGVPRHADFYVFEKGQKLKIKIPIEFTGVSTAVKDLGGVLVKVLYELEIEAEPKNLPQKIEVDISSLKAFGDVVSAKDIKLPEGVALVASPEETVASVYEPKEEVVEETAPDLTQIEVEKKGKEVSAEGKDGEGDNATTGAEENAKEPKKEAKKEEKK